MKITQLVAVEANNTEEAVSNAEYMIEEAMTNPTFSTWFDSFTISNIEDNVFSLADEGKLDTVVEETKNERNTSAEFYIEKINFNNLNETFSNMDYSTPQYSEDIYNLFNLSKIALNHWSPNSHLYDLVEGTADVNEIKTRVTATPERQWLVVVDFYY